MPTYTYSSIKTSANSAIHNKMAVLGSPRSTINDAVRDVFGMVDLRSSKRKSTMAPNLFTDIWQYAWPTDGKGYKVIDLQAQTMQRSREDQFNLVAEEEFDRDKENRDNLLAFTDRDFTRKLMVSKRVDDLSLEISQFDSLTGSGGTWAAFGDATNISVDTYDYVKGSASLKWDISAAGGTTAGLVNTGLNTFDLTEYASAGSAFAWIRITSTTNLTNFKLRIGNDASNYYEMTATTTNEGTAFVNGWNQIRFDFSGKTTTGTVTATSCDYVALYMTKTAGKVSESDYRFDYLVIKRGLIYNLIYYSKYPWQTSAGTWIENSTADTDYLNVDAEEYALILDKVVEYAAREAREYDDYKIARSSFETHLDKYQRDYKSEALPLISSYYNF